MVTNTLAIIKPDAVDGGHVGEILSMIERSTLKITNLNWWGMTVPGAKRFYAEHEGRPYFEKLVNFMVSGPMVAVALQGEDAVPAWRELLKHVRALYASKEHSERNAVHGSDSAESAERELDFFFLEF